MCSSYRLEIASGDGLVCNGVGRVGERVEEHDERVACAAPHRRDRMHHVVAVARRLALPARDCRVTAIDDRVKAGRSGRPAPNVFWLERAQAA